MGKRDHLAQVISLIFQPPFVAAGLYAVTSIYLSGEGSTLLFFLWGLLWVTLFPLLLVWFLARQGKVSDPDLPNRKERFLPYLTMAGFYGIAWIGYYLFRAPLPFLGITACYLGVILVGAFISLFWKISIHASGLAGPVVALCYYFSPRWALLLVLLIPLGWARLQLGKHNFAQISAGALMSGVLTWGILLGLSYFI
ncbi:MAG: hypothetical protein PWP04_1544 [Candidatus Atribacteria bacterium]|nr:hypothetical protein [Candidatus Atribacteria bacterium]